MVHLTEIQEEFLRKILSEYKSNDYKYIDLKLNQQKDGRLCPAIRELSGLYTNNLLIREPDYYMGGAKLYLADEAFEYFKLKDREVAKYFGISITEFQVLKYFIEEMGGGEIYFEDEKLSRELKIDYTSMSRILENLRNSGYIKIYGSPTLDGEYNIIAYKDVFEDKLLEYKEDEDIISLSFLPEMNFVNSIFNIGDNNSLIQNNSNDSSLIAEVVNLLDNAHGYLMKKEQNKDIIDVVKNIEELKKLIVSGNIKTAEDIDALNVLIVKNQSKFRTVLSDFGSAASLFSVLPQLVNFISSHLSIA